MSASGMSPSNRSMAVEAQGLGKCFRIGVEAERHDTLAGSMLAWLRSPASNFRRLRRLRRFDDPDAADIVWAVRDVSFDVGGGEVVGIIGRNGAGKSTLLKVLAGITGPTVGRALIHGRIASLLEVGTGFHPDLTGRENVYLNGTILGMSKVEIDRKFDEIVAFAEVATFIDTPIKRYSSGMKVRLAFSVAAHLEPEILLIDEVLAVGDAAFQRKCLGRMDAVSREGRTVLFVSHNMSAVEALCPRVVVLDGGRVVFDGETREAIEHYLAQDVGDEAAVDLRDHPRRRSGMTPTLTGLRLSTADGAPANGYRLDDDIVFEIDLDPGTTRYPSGVLSLALYNRLGQQVCAMKSDIQSPETFVVDGPTRFRCRLERVRMIPGEYTISVAFSDLRQAVDWIDEVTAIEIRPADVYGTGQAARLRGGFIVPHVAWSSSPLVGDEDGGG